MSKTSFDSEIVMVIGPIEHWWDGNWNTVEHWFYDEWRSRVCHALKDGYLVYHPHMAFKGPWNNKAQVVNDSILTVADYVVCLRPEGIPSEGTDEELAYCEKKGMRVVYAPPPATRDEFDAAIADLMRRIAEVTPTGWFMGFINGGRGSAAGTFVARAVDATDLRRMWRYERAYPSESLVHVEGPFEDYPEEDL